MDTTLGSAYVQIIPSAKGIQGKISEALGGESESAGKSSGLSIANAIKGAIGGAAIGAFLKKAIFEEGGALQQSIGGVETLFKDSAGTVEKYADQAFQTAGLSANDYMSQVTSFSASLLQSLGGDTQKAAESANTAIIDMADNSNKMGTSMDSIQVAYQGFAKQNYTMLDNLKLGYGGTKTEMQRLLADATKISGVKYDLSNLNDVYSAIHVIQTQMGITGTTAKEASTTLTGSFAAMKSAFSNLLGQATLGQDIQPALDGLMTATATFLNNNLLPMLFNFIKALPGAIWTVIKTGVPQLINSGMSMLQSLADGLTSGQPLIDQSIITTIQGMIMDFMTNLPQFLTQGAQIIVQIATGILQNLPQIITAAGQILTTLVTQFVANLPQILQAGMTLISGLAQGLMSNLPAILEAAATVIINLVAGIATHLPDILQTGIEIIGQLISGLITAIPNIIMNLPKIISSISDTFNQYDWKSIGGNILSGIATGISNAVSGLVGAAIRACGQLVDSVKNFFGIKSPSKLMANEVGQFIPSGIAKGILGNMAPLEDAMDSMNGLVSGGISPSVYATASSAAQPSATYMAGNGAIGSGFTQSISITSPKELSASEIARQTRNATRQMVLNLKGV